jgi:triacylglycerol lipase
MGLSKLNLLLPPVNAQHFQAKTIAYHPMNAELLGFMANLVYAQDENDIRKTLQDDNRLRHFEVENMRFIEDIRTDTQALVISDTEKVIVSFRGTNGGTKDWWTNMDYNLVEHPKMAGKVHEGFNNALDTIWDAVKATAFDFKGEGGKYRSLWFTGHSLGGALANLAVARLLVEDYAVYGLYTFGQPRVGDREFARNFNIDFKSRYFRFVNNCDIVTRIPKREMGYNHAGMVLCFDDEGNLSADLHSWFRFQDQVNGTMEVLRNLLKGDLIGDHSMENAYLPLLQKHNNHNPFSK